MSILNELVFFDEKKNGKHMEGETDFIIEIVL